MKKSFLLLITLVVSIVAMAGPVTPDEARQNVAQFMNPRRAAAVTQNPEALRLVSTSHYRAQQNTLAPSYYIFNVGKGEGYVIAAADDRVPAVLGYSNRGQIDPDNMPENMKEWLQSYSDQLEYLNSHPDVPIARRTVSGEAIRPLLDSRYTEGPIAWDQTAPYNDLCPLDGSSHSLVGCVATAMAQLMYYWKYPAATTETIPGYTTKKRKIQMPDIPAGTIIDWDNILPRYTGYETDAQKNAVANLMLLCGTAVEMDYTFEFSGASTALAARALRDYFDYDEATNYRQRVDYHEGEWNQKVYDELKAGRPVYYDGDSSGSGHAFVVDGYGGDDYFHVNWGWGGSSNDYFLLSILDSKNNSGSGASKSADGYSFGQGAIFGVQPNTGKPDKELRLLTATAGAIFCDTVMTRKSISENFKVKLGFAVINHWDATYKFDLGVVCVDAYGQKLFNEGVLATGVELGPDWGMADPSGLAVDLKLGSGTNEMTCFVIPISRPTGTDTWYPSIGAYDYYVGINVKGDTLKLFPPVFNLNGTLAFTGKKEAKTPIPVQTTITNNGTFWKGELFFMLNGKMTGGRHFDIEAGQTKPLDFTVIPDSAGRYEIAVATRQYNSKTNDYDYTTFIVDSVTVDSAAAANLTLTYDVTNATNYVVKEDTLKLLVAATNNGNDTYENQILADLYKDGHDGYYYNTKTLKKDVKIAAGETVQLPFDFVNLEDDSYLFIIKYLSEGEWKSIQTRNFTVQTREPDPVPVLSTTSQTANAVRESGSWIVKTDTAYVSVLAKNTGTIDYNDNIIVRLYKMTTATGGPQVAVARTFVNLPVGADTTFVVQFPGLEDGATYFYWTNYVADNKETPGSQNTPMFTVMLPKPVEEAGYYLVSDLNSWSTTDQSYPFEKLRDGKSWEITFKAPDGDLWLKVAPASAYDDQDGFWTHLFCAVQNGTSDLSGTMIVGDAGAWLMPASYNAETYTMRIVPSEMTYTITYTEKTDGIQMVSNGQQGNVTIYGVNGNKVDEVNASNLQQRLKSLPKGLYIVRFGQKTATIRN